MLSEEFCDSLNGLVFPRKLWRLASNDDVKSVRWARNGTTVEIDSVLLCTECFHPKIFNVKSNQHVLRQLSYYKFEKLDQKKKLWEFQHALFQAGREDLTSLIKRTPQRVPKKFADDVERRCSSRIRSMPSRKKTYKAESDDETELENGFEETKPSVKKFKFKEEEDEYIPNCRYSFSNATLQTPSCSNSYFNNTAALSNAGSSKEKSKLKVEDSNECPPIKKKRGRPRKRPLSPEIVQQVPPPKKLKAKYIDVDEQTSAEERFANAATNPPKKLYYDRATSNWGHEKFNFKGNNSMWEEPKVLCPKYITESAPKQAMFGYPRKDTYVKQEDENGLYEFSRRSDLYYHDMDSKIPLKLPDQFLEESSQDDLPSTTDGKECFPLLIRVSRSESRENEIGEIHYINERQDYQCENRSAEKLRGGYWASLDGTQNRNHQNDESINMINHDDSEMNQNEYTNKSFTFSNYMSPNYLKNNLNGELQNHSTRKPTTSSQLFLPGKTAISSPQLSDFQGNKFFKKLDQLRFESNISGTSEDILSTPQSCSKNIEDIPIYPLPPHGSSTTNENRFYSDFDYEKYIQENFNRSSADLNDNSDGRKNNLKDSSAVDQIPKSSQSCITLPLSGDFQEKNNVPSNSPERKLDSSFSNIRDHNYCYEKETDYSLIKNIAKREILAAMPESSKNDNPNSISHQLSAPGIKYPDDQNELVNPSSKPNETKIISNGIFGMKQSFQNSDIPSSGNFQPPQDSSVPNTEQNREYDFYDNAHPNNMDLNNELDDNYIRSVDNLDDVEFLEVIGPLRNHLEAEDGEEHSGLKSATNNLFSREVKPLQLIEFLGQRLKEGCIYSWDFINKEDIVIKGCAFDLLNWYNRMPGQ